MKEQLCRETPRKPDIPLSRRILDEQEQGIPPKEGGKGMLSRREFLKKAAGLGASFFLPSFPEKGISERENSNLIAQSAEIYLRNCRENIVTLPEGKRAIIPSKAYAQGIFCRDSFYASLGLGDFSLSESCYRFFQENQDKKTGRIPTFVPFNKEVPIPQIEDDESALLFIIWSGILRQKGFEVEKEVVEKAFFFVQDHVQEGFYVSPPGPFKYWADTVAPECPERIAYNQGLYILALRSLQKMGRNGISQEQVDKARENYRSFYSSRLGYLTLGKDSYFAFSQDVSSLLPEFLGRFLFEEKTLDDEVVLQTVNHHLQGASVYLPSGRLAGVKVISSPWGQFLPQERFFAPGLNNPGDYQNGGYWPMYTLTELSLAYQISGRKEYQRVIEALLEIELAKEPKSKEFLRLSPGRVGSFDPSRSGYSWNTFASQAFSWAGLA